MKFIGIMKRTLFLRNQRIARISNNIIERSTVHNPIGVKYPGLNWLINCVSHIEMLIFWITNKQAGGVWSASSLGRWLFN